MSEAKHTPGPWIVDTDYIIQDGGTSDENTIAIVGDQEEWKANAHLIAAAPELLGVAEHFCCHRNMDILDGTCVFRCGRIKNGMCQQATDCWILKAIQKARGQG